jgi:hypothetical protein
VRPGKPNDDPKAQPDHEDYDPFHLPMPTLKTGKQRQPSSFREALGVCSWHCSRVAPSA